MTPAYRQRGQSFQSCKKATNSNLIALFLQYDVMETWSPMKTSFNAFIQERPTEKEHQLKSDFNLTTSYVNTKQISTRRVGEFCTEAKLIPLLK
tara:strand:+ start:3517 stop:3798 length:282 start_codon:yes stop_codon:yes gene_type:complete